MRISPVDREPDAGSVGLEARVGQDDFIEELRSGARSWERETEFRHPHDIAGPCECEHSDERLHWRSLADTKTTERCKGPWVVLFENALFETTAQWRSACASP